MTGQAGQHHLQCHDHDARRPLVRYGHGRSVVGGCRHRCGAQALALGRMPTVVFSRNVWDSRDLRVVAVQPIVAVLRRICYRISQSIAPRQALSTACGAICAFFHKVVASEPLLIASKRFKMELFKAEYDDFVAISRSANYAQTSGNGGIFRPRHGGPWRLRLSP